MNRSPLRGIVPGLLVGAVLLCTGLACSTGQKQEPATRTELRIGTDATYPPFEMMDPESSRPVGFDIDLVSEICRVNGWKPEFVVTPFDGMIPGLLNQKYDVVISAMTITPQRAAVVDFTDPYYLAGQVVAVPLDDTTIQSVVDLNGKRVGVQLGTTGEMMAKRLTGVAVFSFDNIGAAFLDMANGNLDAVLNDFPTTQAYITKHHTARVVGEILSTEHYGMAVRRTDDTLLAQLNAALAQIKASPVYSEIHRKWFGVDPVALSSPTEDSLAAAADSL